MGTTSQIFVSYRRAGALALAGRMAEHLKKRFPHTTVFYDVDSNEPGVNYRTKTHDAITHSQVMLAVVDPSWLSQPPGDVSRLWDPDDYVALELRTAASLEIPVIPVIDPYARLPTRSMLPADLDWFPDQQAFHLHHDVSFDDEMARLSKRLLDFLPPPPGGGVKEPTAVMMPSLGQRATEGTVFRWLKGVGDFVEVDELLLEVSTDESDSEIRSPATGTVLEIRVQEYETVASGEVLAVIAVR